MLTRREAFLLMGAGVLGAPLFAEAVDTRDVDKHLRDDVEHLLPRENSEEGVPVFLACVNLVGSKTAALTPLNTAVASEFRRDAAAWERNWPNSPETEVGKLIEVLAYRNFSQGAGEPAS